MDYDLTRLGPSNFEGMCRSLFEKTFGPSVSQFGAGPDGGREATYKGTLPALADKDGQPWDGLVVLQAKFIQRPLGAPKDQNWLIQQAKKELRGWANPASKRRSSQRAEYMILATNVVATPAAGGGVDRLQELFEELAPAAGIKGWQFWHADKITSMLNDASHIRRAYRGLITPGDVLATLMDKLDGMAAESGEALRLYTAQSLVHERFVRLAEAGGQSRLTLEQVGVDLPIRQDSSPNGGLALAELINIGDHVLRSDSRGQSPAQVALLGGPGQGKTTLSNLLAQTYRVALLKDDPVRYGSHVTPVIVETLELLKSQRIPMPRNRRWPIRLNLASLAERMATGAEALLTSISAEVSTSTGVECGRYSVRSWFRQYPWILILDGYDEVASPTARTQIQRELTDLLIMADSLNADLFTVLTTRPQGYENDFVEMGASHLHLRPLSHDEALQYAERFATIHFAQDQTERTKVLDRIKRASEDPETARLMVSPLQVTIMTLLLESRERAPHGRFRLFDAYFDTIYRREMNKPGPTGQLLEQRRRDIEFVHERVGLELQAAGEAAETSDAVMSVERLRAIVLGRLQDDQGHDLDRAEWLADAIVAASTNRLVLLVPNKHGVGFEVRSLQEYMAARAITQGSDTDVVRRLRVAAPSAHWRNVWLLGVARTLDVKEHLRSQVLGSLNELGAEAIPHRVGLAAELAAELLSDEVATDSPATRLQLANILLTILDLPPRPFEAAELLDLLAQERPVLRSTIEIGLKRAAAGRADTAATAWILLQRLVRYRGLLAQGSALVLGSARMMDEELILAASAWVNPSSEVSRKAKTRTGRLSGFINEDPRDYLESEDDIEGAETWMNGLSHHKVRTLKSNPTVVLPEVPSTNTLAPTVEPIGATGDLADAIAIAVDSIAPDSWGASAEVRNLLWRSLRRAPVAASLMD